MPRPAPIALLALVALAIPGCVSLQDSLVPTGNGIPGALTFGEAVGMAQPTRGAEPNLAVLDAETLFIAAVASSQERPNAVQGAAWLWRSGDGGETWATLREPLRVTPLDSVPPLRRPFGSSDADVVTSPDGWVYYTDWWNWGAPVTGTPRAGNYLVERSSDGGATWESSPVTIPDPTEIDRQWLLAGDDGFVAIFYAYFHPVQNAVRGLDPFRRGDSIMSLQAVRSFDHGATWGSPVTVVPPVPETGYQIAHPTRLPDGTLAMPFGETEPGTDFWRSSSKVRIAISRDQGLSWYLRDVARAPQGFDNLWAVQGAADDAGNLFVAWAARTGENMTTFVASSRDRGESWSAPVPLRAAGLNFLPWVAAAGDGRVAVGWYGGNATGDPREVPDDAEWHAYVAESRGAGVPFVVSRVSEIPVKTGPLCPIGAACGSNRELLDYVSLEYGPDGRLHYAFAKSREVDGAKAGHVHYAGTAIPIGLP